MARIKKAQTTAITSDYFQAQDVFHKKGLTCRMRLEYNKLHGLNVFINYKGEVQRWILHSQPYPAEIPKKDFKIFVGIFVRSIQKFNPQAKFTQTTI